MLRYFETYLLDVMKGKKKGIFPSIVKGMFWVLSWGYFAGSSLHHYSFDKGWRRRYYPPIPFVISVGNIVAGGTGKTPVTMKIAKEFSEKYPIAILSRGYRSPAETLSTPITLSQGRGPLYPSSYCGDEPYMISENIPEACLYVGKNRKKASVMAAKAGAHMLLLDDGLQYRQLARDLEIIVINANDPFGQGYLLPRGQLRESTQGLKRADLIVLNHAYDRAQYLTAKRHVSRVTSAPIVGMRPCIEGVYDISSKNEYSINRKIIGVFSGIGTPELFRILLQTHNACIVAEKNVANHTMMNQKELQNFASHCKDRGAEYLVCTEKDKVKLSEKSEVSLPILWVKMDLEITEGEENWNTLLHTVKSRLDKIPVVQGVNA